MFCTKCGRELLKGAKVCPNCGIYTKKGVEAEQAAENVQVKRQEFNGERERTHEEAYRNLMQMRQNPMPVQISSEYQPISMWGYFGYEMLFKIPIINIILLLVFSFGGTQNKNLRNFARSYFCKAIIDVVLALLIFAYIGSIVNRFW